MRGRIVVTIAAWAVIAGPQWRCCTLKTPAGRKSKTGGDLGKTHYNFDWDQKLYAYLDAIRLTDE